MYKQKQYEAKYNVLGFTSQEAYDRGEAPETTRGCEIILDKQAQQDERTNP